MGQITFFILEGLLNAVVLSYSKKGDSLTLLHHTNST